MRDIAILTRPMGRNRALAQRLESAQWQVFEWPALHIEPLPGVAGQVPLPGDFDLAVFVSGNAAQLYLAQLSQIGLTSWPAACAGATVGPASAAALHDSGWFEQGATVLHPGPEVPRHDSEALWDLLVRRGSLPRRVLLVRGTQGRDWLAERLREHGVSVVPHSVYRRSPAVWDAASLACLAGWAREGRYPAWLLTSGEGIDAVRANIERAELTDWWAGCRFVVTHPGLAQRLRLESSTARVCVPADDAIFNAFVAA